MSDLRYCSVFAGLSVLASLTVYASPRALAQAPAQPPPSGVTHLPHDPPPVTLQSPVPPAAAPMAPPERPLTVSPGALELRTLLADRAITVQDAVAIALAENRSLALSVEALARSHGRTVETRAPEPDAGSHGQRCLPCTRPPARR